MENTKKTSIPLREDFWTEPSVSEEKPRLIGSKCEACGELFFPRKEKGWCVHCRKKALTDVMLSRQGKIVSFSVVMQKPGGGAYQGPVPYAYGLVALPEGLKLVTQFSADDFNDLEVGQDVEFVIGKLCDDDEGNEILTFKFKPTY